MVASLAPRGALRGAQQKTMGSQEKTRLHGVNTLSKAAKKQVDSKIAFFFFFFSPVYSATQHAISYPVELDENSHPRCRERGMILLCRIPGIGLSGLDRITRAKYNGGSGYRNMPPVWKEGKKDENTPISFYTTTVPVGVFLNREQMLACLLRSRGTKMFAWPAPLRPSPPPVWSEKMRNTPASCYTLSVPVCVCFNKPETVGMPTTPTTPRAPKGLFPHPPPSISPLGVFIGNPPRHVSGGGVDGRKGRSKIPRGGPLREPGG